MHIAPERLKELLLGSDVVDEKTFQTAMDEATRSGRTIPDVLIGRGDITEEYFTELLEPYFGAAAIDLKRTPIPPEVLQLIPEAYAKSKHAVVFAVDRTLGVAKVAMVDPLDYEIIEYLRARLDLWIEPYLATTKSIKYGLKQYKQTIGVEFNEIIAENVKKFLLASGETDVGKMAEAVPIVNILDSIVEQAVALNASDIHFEPLEDNVLIRFRTDGILHEMLTLHKVIEPILVARVKILASLQIDEHRVPQDGRFRFEFEEGNTIDIRVNVMPVMHGEKIAMRLLKNASRPLTLEDLGVSSTDITIIADEIKKPHGMMLVTGPTGHGKTTTLYAMMHILNTPRVNITTIEDPIEYEMPRVNQTQVNVKAGVTFGSGLRALVRQNPDIVMVGEIRDNETVEISVQAALTGHLVLSSLHTNDAPGAIPRLIDMGAPPFLLASTINLVIAQRLVRKVCTSCIESYKTPAEVKKMIETYRKNAGESGKNVHMPVVIYRGKGCPVCGGSGYSGQIGVFEVLRVSDAIRTLILKMAPGGEIRMQGRKEGMTTLFEDGLAKVERGVTSIEEILRVVHE